MALHLVIMAGGSGTRFWPKSTAKKPKQLLSFSPGGPTLLEQTLTRFDGLVPAGPAHRMIVTTQLLRGACSEGAPGVNVLAEPAGRNTAPCVYWAAREIAARDPKGVMLVMPADHYIARPEAFAATIREAVRWAETHDDLVTLGVKPTRPETGYGYLKIGAELPGGSARRVDAFVEKPNQDKAREFVSAGNYFWNGGMFVWRAEVVLKAFDEHMPEMRSAWESAQGRVEAAYPKLTATSIDYGVMEKARNVVSFALDCGWDDLGSWTTLEEMADVLKARQEGGVATAGEILAVESAGNIVDAPGKLVALLGVKDLIVVEAGGVLMVADKRRAQDIKLVVDRVKKERPGLA
jgi:mannose-1-phosphate guanylyltransferase